LGYELQLPFFGRTSVQDHIRSSRTVSVPPNATCQDFIGTPDEVSVGVLKSVTPTGQVSYGDELTYTLVIAAPPGTQLGLFDPLEGTAFARFLEQPANVEHADAAITGTLGMTVTVTVPVSIPSVGHWAAVSG
jgi:hypothetical protein